MCVFTPLLIYKLLISLPGIQATTSGYTLVEVACQ
jgi:hypothetical protein